MTGKKNAIPYLVLVLKGVVVGFGAIMPGISGGTLCVAFGMYRPLLNVFSNPVKTLREDGWKLFAFVLGAGLGFVGRVVNGKKQSVDYLRIYWFHSRHDTGAVERCRRAGEKTVFLYFYGCRLLHIAWRFIIASI